MPKMKTRKSVSKRFKVSSKKKLIAQKPGHGHFNARDTGKMTRRKRNNIQIKSSDEKSIRQNIPYA